MLQLKCFPGEPNAHPCHRGDGSAAEELWGNISLHLVYDLLAECAPVQGSAPLQKDAVNPLPAQLLHKPGKVDMSIPLRKLQQPALSVQIGLLQAFLLAAGGNEGGDRGSGFDHMGSKGRPKTGIADNPQGIPPPLHPAGEQGIVSQDRARPRHDGGMGVAVSNAIEEVLAIADSVAESNAMDGVARYIEENCL